MSSMHAASNLRRKSEVVRRYLPQPLQPHPSTLLNSLTLRPKSQTNPDRGSVEFSLEGFM